MRELAVKVECTESMISKDRERPGSVVEPSLLGLL